MYVYVFVDTCTIAQLLHVAGATNRSATSRKQLPVDHNTTTIVHKQRLINGIA